MKGKNRRSQRIQEREAVETLEAIRRGEIGSLVIPGEHGESIFALNLVDLLGIGVVMLDRQADVSFLNGAAGRLLNAQAGVGRSWRELFAFDAQAVSQLEAVFLDPSTARRVTVTLSDHRSAEVEVQPDPRDSERRIIVLRDNTEVSRLRRMVTAKSVLADLVGKSRSMEIVFEQIRQLARLNSTVLIQGETGTGKELAARAIHSLGLRKEGVFIAVNCAALSESLIASQLFGHRRGSFTGAHGDQKGFFEEADGGTLLLDEIGDLPSAVQIALLRVLERKEVTRVGEALPRQVDVRIITATNRDLKEAVTAGAFRSDLFYRLQVGRVTLPPLRSRREDIPLLIAHFLHDFRSLLGREVDALTERAMHACMRYPWPGNVRELRNAIEFALISTGQQVIDLEHLPPEIQAPEIQGGPRSPREAEPAGTLSESAIERALQMTAGNRSAAAKLLGVSRATFYRRLSKPPTATG